MEEKNNIFPEQEVADLPQGLNETVENDDDDDLKPFKTADYVKLPFSEKLFPSIFRENISTAPANRKVPIMLSLFAPSSLYKLIDIYFPKFSIKYNGVPIHFISPSLIIPILFPKTLASSI